MKNKPKLSFLMAAHNEEKLISQALGRLVQIKKDYPNMEVLIGLDGCVDKTEEIVNKFAKRYKLFKIFKFEERRGKQFILKQLESHMTCDIVIIHDADWELIYKSKKDLLDYLKLFDNPKVGGITWSIDGETSRSDFLKSKSWGILVGGLGNELLIQYMKKSFTKKKDGIRIYEPKKIKFYPFVDVYRREAMDKTKHNPGLRAGDHVERALRILNAGYDLIAFDNPNWPHFINLYNKQSIKDLLKQKTRGIIAKKKVQLAYNFKVPFFRFYLPFLFFLIWNSFKVKRLKYFFAIYGYLFVMLYAVIYSKIKQKKISVKEIWNLRIKR